MAQFNWTLDPMHSQAQFKVRHMMISTVTGEFKKFDLQLTTEETDFSTAKASFSADVKDIETKNKQREDHLKTFDFFDAANHPKVTFESTHVKKTDDNSFTVTGDLTMRGTTKSVDVDVDFGGIIRSREGQYRVGFEASTKINRKGFGLNFDALTETGGMVVGDEVRIFLSIEMLHE